MFRMTRFAETSRAMRPISPTTAALSGRAITLEHVEYRATDCSALRARDQRLVRFSASSNGPVRFTAARRATESTPKGIAASPADGQVRGPRSSFVAS